MSITEALRLLELTPPFSKADVTKAYRQAQMVWHPDRFPGNEELRAKAHSQTCLVNEAFTEISRALEAGYDFRKSARRRTSTPRKTQVSPQTASEFNARGIDYQKKGKTNKAVADFTEAIRLDPSAAVYYRNRGAAYAHKRRLTDAIADFTEAVRLNPNIELAPPDADSYRASAAVYERKADYEKAISDLTEAIRLEPEVAESYFQRGSLYKERGEYGKAIADFNETRRLQPRRRFCFREDFRRHGKLCLSKGEYEQAVADYSEVIQSFKHGTSDRWGELVGDYFCRARAYRMKGDLDKAISDYSEVIQLYPNIVPSGWQWQPTAAYYKCRAQAYYKKGDFRNAIADLTEAIRRDPSGRWSIIDGGLECVGPDPREEGWKHKEALGALSALCADSGDLDGAIQYQKQFLKLHDLTAEEASEGSERLMLYESRKTPRL